LRKAFLVLVLVVLDLLALILLLRLSSSDAKYDITMLRKVCLGPVVVLVLVSFILLISLPSLLLLLLSNTFCSNATPTIATINVNKS
jgi:hypothetical protein